WAVSSLAGVTNSLRKLLSSPVASSYNVRIVNLSIGRRASSGDLPLLEIAYDGFLNLNLLPVTVHVGNTTDDYPLYPAAYNKAGAIRVTMIDPDDNQPQGHSTSIVQAGDVLAYGSYCTALGVANEYYDIGSNGGVSYAIPVVCGVAALAWAEDDTLSRSEVIDLVLENARPVYNYGNGASAF